MSDIILLEGVFYEDRQRGGLMVTSQDQCQCVAECLSRFEGLEVQLLAHYVPPNPPVMGAWGMGSCHWAPSDECPAGHASNPMYLFRASNKGELKVETEGTFVGDTRLQLDHLPGHSARILVAPLISRESLGSLSNEDLHASLQRMHDLLGSLGKGI